MRDCLRVVDKCALSGLNPNAAVERRWLGSRKSNKAVFQGAYGGGGGSTPSTHGGGAEASELSVVVSIAAGGDAL